MDDKGSPQGGEQDGLPAARRSGERQVLTREEAAAIEQTKALKELATAVQPLIEQVMNTNRATQREEQEHELRMAEHDAAVTERVHKRLYPLLWFGALVVAAVIGWASYVGRWEIATHILTAILAWTSGYTVRQRIEQRSLEND